MTSDEIDRIITMPDIDMEWKAFRDSVIQRSQTKRRIYRSVRDFAFVLGIVVMVSAVGYASAKASGARYISATLMPATSKHLLRLR